MTRKFGYVRGAVLPVPRKKLVKYRKMARVVAKVWKDHGALEHVEAIAPHLEKGKVTSFPRSLKLRKGEVVIFSWTLFRSKAHSERVLKNVFDDKRLKNLMNPSDFPFDGMRMYWGAFKTMICK